jgi:hypothetical protein
MQDKCKMMRIPFRRSWTTKTGNEHRQGTARVQDPTTAGKTDDYRSWQFVEARFSTLAVGPRSHVPFPSKGPKLNSTPLHFSHLPAMKTIKSPIINPDLESGIPSKLPPGNRSGLAEITASFALGSKPGLHPDSLDSPGISAGQEMFQEKRGVLFKHFASHVRSLRKQV